MEPLHERFFNPLLQFATLLQFESQEYVIGVDGLAQLVCLIHVCEPRIAWEQMQGAYGGVNDEMKV